MAGAFFVGRKEIVEWINETCELSITKIEDTAFGGIACMLLDIMYPGQVPMHKVDWSAKQSFEYVSNYKVLQTCFVKLGIEKNIDVDRLIKGRYQDNLEFMQWFKRFFEMHMQGKGDYDCAAQRCKGKGGSKYALIRPHGALSKTSKFNPETIEPRLEINTNTAPRRSARLQQMKTRVFETSPDSVLAMHSGGKPSRSSLAPSALVPECPKTVTRRRASMIPMPAKPVESVANIRKRKSTCASDKSIRDHTENIPSETLPVPSIQGNAKRRRASLLEVQKKINAVVDQVGTFENDADLKSEGVQRRKSLRISLLAENRLRNDIEWIDI